MTKKGLKAKITAALRSGIKNSTASIANLVPGALTAGKLYEAYVLGLLCQRLQLHEGMQFTLVGGKKIRLKSSPGPINPNYPCIHVAKNGQHVATIWTDIEFVALSAHTSGATTFSSGEYHEMDIALVSPKSHGRPKPDEIHLAVECKNTGYQKSLLREILGIRRELSLLQVAQPSFFNAWPRAQVPADPPSCIAVFSTDASVLKFAAPGAFFGIDFYHEPL